MRDSICPKCGRIGKKRIYRNHDKYAYERYEHWDEDSQTMCHIGRIPTVR